MGCGWFLLTPLNLLERGSNENLNGLVRKYIPKSFDFF